ncbi:MAG: hypothetical protein JST92_03070, partial [Deltaproteobacteria bacterium]|nr:hypothetical protein [Deltaproteobacteria bacterium]
LATAPALPCTILSGQDPNGVVWVGNNEDWSFDFETRMNVIVGAPGELSGVAFVYDFPEAEIQGGLNEAGLFFDFNSLPSVDPAKVEGWAKRRTSPAAARRCSCMCCGTRAPSPRCSRSTSSTAFRLCCRRRCTSPTRAGRWP